MAYDIPTMGAEGSRRGRFVEATGQRLEGFRSMSVGWVIDAKAMDTQVQVIFEMIVCERPIRRSGMHYRNDRSCARLVGRVAERSTRSEAAQTHIQSVHHWKMPPNYF